MPLSQLLEVINSALGLSDSFRKQPKQVSINSIRGSRYFGPSKMSFLNLVKHSLSIMAVFKTSVFIRSIIFVSVYFYFILQDISIITLIPPILIFFMIVSIFLLSKRENISEFNKSLENINNIEIFK